MMKHKPLSVFCNKLPLLLIAITWLLASCGGSSSSSGNSSETLNGILNTISAPKNVSTTAGNKKVTISWDAVAEATEYKLYQGPSNLSIAKVSQPASISQPTSKSERISREISNLKNGVVYSFRVKTSKDKDDSAYSDYKYARPLPPKPSTPHSLKATTGSKQVTLTWQGSTDADAYLVYQDNRRIATAFKKEFKLINLENWKTYQFKVRAYNLGGLSTYSNTVSVQPQPPIPAVPTNFTAQTGHKSKTVTLKWSPVADATTYGIKYQKKQDTAFTVKVASTNTIDIKDLSVNVGYTFQVQSANSKAASDYSAALESTPTIGPPLNVKVAYGNRTLTLFWDTVVGATTYTLYYSKQTFANATPANLSLISPVKINKIDNITAKRTAVTGLENGIQYHIVLTAKDNSYTNPGHFSKEVHATPLSLNDTGINASGFYQEAFSGGDPVIRHGRSPYCLSTGTKSTDYYPGPIPFIPNGQQDCHQGRDYEARTNKLTKVGKGDKGFDFTKLDKDGKPLTIQDQAWLRELRTQPNKVWSSTGNEKDGTIWTCVKDNVTGLTWSEEITVHDRWTKDSGVSATSGNVAGYLNATNKLASKLCGLSAWRLPTPSELLSIHDLTLSTDESIKKSKEQFGTMHFFPLRGTSREEGSSRGHIFTSAYSHSGKWVYIFNSGYGLSLTRKTGTNSHPSAYLMIVHD